MKRARNVLFMLGAGAMCASLITVVPALSGYSPEDVAYAQTKRGGKKKKPKPVPAAATGEFDASAPLTTRSEEATPSAREREKEKKDSGVVEAKTLDGGTRVFRFGELDIEGRLRSPQLVYFLRRVRAEFAAGDLGHRSFMRELSDTRHDPNF